MRHVACAHGRSHLRHRLRPYCRAFTGVVMGVAVAALGMPPALANRKPPAGGQTPVRAASKWIGAAPQPPLDPSRIRVPVPKIDPKDRLAKKPRNVWDRLADCESGEWQANGKPLEDSSRWDYGARGPRRQFEGGLNFHPDTWEAYRSPGMPAHAGRASKDEQIRVAERVLAAQGWDAWPRCSRKLGFR